MQQRQNNYLQFRRRFPFLAYEGHSIHYTSNKLQVQYQFNLSDQFRFEPGFMMELNPEWQENIPDKLLRNIVFQIGMAELISYWKSCCSPEIIIRPFTLPPEAVQWWKDLFYNGLGEFFYTNGINPDYDDFLNFGFTDTEFPENGSITLGESYLLPLGGGKDSSVTLEILLRNKHKVVPFFLNPLQAAINVAKAAGLDKRHSVSIYRTIDPGLLLLNEHGFLNGHTPFSALLAFYSLIPAALTGCRNIVLSNESSANEPTIPGTNINHQYSKSFGFEKAFREYCRNYISDDFNYFSFLRPLNELQIGALFSGYKKFHQVFRSCNAGSKSGIWCGKCPKCLFTFIILSPFAEPEELVSIFGSNLLDDQGLSFYFDQLCGIEEEKPFDCIGTVDEVNVALHETITNYGERRLPVLLERYRKGHLFGTKNNKSFSDHLKQLNQEHFVPVDLLKLLRKVLDESIF